ncbi:MAG: hypothetical protein ING01_07345 [Rhodobacter sp.]|nr:hypothetical protein [Rhodobacter sp.]
MIAAPLARALTGVAPRRAASAPVLRKGVRAPVGLRRWRGAGRAAGGGMPGGLQAP